MPITHTCSTGVVVVYAFGGMAYLQMHVDNKPVPDKEQGIFCRGGSRT